MTAKNAVNGDYFVRQREENSNEYIMTLIYQNKPTHHLIKPEGTAFSINKKVFTPNATTLEEVSRK